MGDAHPHDSTQGEIKALETIRFSLSTHQGCYGECNFCAISVHQGRTIRSRSEERHMHSLKDFASKVLKMNPKKPKSSSPLHRLIQPLCTILGYTI